MSKFFGKTQLAYTNDGLDWTLEVRGYMPATYPFPFMLTRHDEHTTRQYCAACENLHQVCEVLNTDKSFVRAWGDEIVLAASPERCEFDPDGWNEGTLQLAVESALSCTTDEYRTIINTFLPDASYDGLPATAADVARKNRLALIAALEAER